MSTPKDGLYIFDRVGGSTPPRLIGADTTLGKLELGTAFMHAAFNFRADPSIGVLAVIDGQPVEPKRQVHRLFDRGFESQPLQRQKVGAE